MSIDLALNNSLSGLRINQRNMAVLSQNIANANTVGYSRQLVAQSSVNIEGIGNGVKFDEVIRKMDKYLQQAVQENGSLMNSASVISEYADLIQKMMGNPGSSNGADDYVTNFFNKLQVLAEHPESAANRSAAVASAQTLAQHFSDMSKGLSALQQQAESDMGDAVLAMNTAMKTLDTLNASITRAAALGQSTAGLLDERDKALKDLSGYVDISTFFDASGAVNVYTTGGVALVDGARHEVRFTPRVNEQAFIEKTAAGAVTVVSLDTSGKEVGSPQILITGGTSNAVTTTLMGGKLKGLQQVRDTIIPDALSQIDMFSSRLRDEVNRVHNQGVGFPAPNSYMGTRQVRAFENSDWSGSVRIAILDATGKPIPSVYPDESFTGMRALKLDLSKLNSGVGAGKPTVQSIIDEINNQFGAPTPKARVGALNSIQLVSNNDMLPNAIPPTFNFDFDLENITNGAATFFVSGVTVRSDTGLDITNVTNTAKQYALDSINTYQTTAGSSDVKVRLTGPQTPVIGDMIYLSDPGTLPPTIGGLPSTSFVGYFKVKSVSGTDITFELATPPTATQSVNQVGVNMIPAYDKVAAGDKRRTADQGTYTADLSGAAGSSYYDITATVAVLDKDGYLKQSTITYRVNNNEKQIRNDRYPPTTVTGDGALVIPPNAQATMRAMLVDENGAELPKVNGNYVDAPGYLKLVASNASYTIAIDSLDSKQLGNSTVTPSVAGSGRGFSHYFDLNNFFVSNKPIATGDTTEGSAFAMQVAQRIVKNPNLLATGKMALSSQPANPNSPAQYTYVRYSGDNSLGQALAGAAETPLAFDGAGTLAGGANTLNGYLAQVMSHVATLAATADTDASNAETLYNGFKTKLDTVTGVNLDEELANTITYQNAYSASAKMIKVASDLYQDLLQLF